MRREFSVQSINLSVDTGTRKVPVQRAVLREGHGIVGDAHAGDWHRQVSLLAEEDIHSIPAGGREIGNGEFAENLTTRGIDLASLPVGTQLHIGPALLEITQIGKECHGGGCAIRRELGDCIMPRRGVFARVLRGGEIDSESRCHYDL
jgi:MOSC domain-containing protein YiiM